MCEVCRKDAVYEISYVVVFYQCAWAVGWPMRCCMLALGMRLHEICLLVVAVVVVVV